ncbi:hypothetical protein CCB80_05780 [Armatimonadetes bacterium Uphvl-Ar1]|nr:hypothetical protein CCB80_05780 [Armatimonadetes bacterium Uphvl-Ar1]
MDASEQAEGKTQSKGSATGVILLATGLAVGLSAAAWLLKQRHDKKISWDPERILDACDAAAAKLDEILFQESRQAG